ncbi:IS3 family transposase [Kitasatospora sp. NPDC101155]|uniref:IS3 family transposase n=1 Tax=Kitasatospora sp. NPDC101155 TaxID=3364097 RepID=UPI003816C998
MGVNRSTYYAWLAGRPAAAVRQRAEDELAEEIREIHASSRGAYGVPRVHAALRRKGHALPTPASTWLTCMPHPAGDRFFKYTP